MTIQVRLLRRSGDLRMALAHKNYDTAATGCITSISDGRTAEPWKVIVQKEKKNEKSHAVGEALMNVSRGKVVNGLSQRYLKGYQG